MSRTAAAFLGYASGEHAPGVKDPVAAVRSVHHLLLGHGLAVQALRAADPDLRVGIVLNTYPVEAASDRAADVDAARRIDGLQNRIFMDPVLRGSYPVDVVRDLARFVDLSEGAANGVVRSGDLEIISQPTDLLGFNYYNPYLVSAGGGPTDSGGLWVGATVCVPPPGSATDCHGLGDRPRWAASLAGQGVPGLSRNPVVRHRERCSLSRPGSEPSRGRGPPPSGPRSPAMWPQSHARLTKVPTSGATSPGP